MTIWRHEFEQLKYYQLREIAEKATEVMESRKILHSDGLAEYTMVERKQLEELFELLYDAGVITYGFDSPDYQLDSEEH